MTTLFLHGVPDTSNLWQPLITALGLRDEDYVAPDMPGFVSPLPAGFSATKQAYLDWLIEQVESLHARSGPVDLVGHDWGAALCLRLAHLRPELIRSWAVANGALGPSYRWHSTARIWQTPVLGEIFMALARPARMTKLLIDAGMPESVAKVEVQQAGPDMKRAILRLYRSAKSLSSEWGADLSILPKPGLVIWGDRDPFVPLKLAEKFSEAQGVPLHVEQGAGHWSICQRPEPIAARLKQHWGS
jgi:pimeloyl-ACP methyl ester carboxylesterase